MNNWININLPWSISIFDTAESAPSPPNLSKKTKKEFGTTLANQWNKITKQDHTECDKYDEKCQNELSKEQSPILSQSVAAYDDELLKRYGSKKGVAKLVAYRQLLRKIKEWEATQPETITFQQKLKEFNDAENLKSFCGLRLNQPGTLIIVNDQQYLIGDINALRGVCDDCTAFDSNTIVQRYKVVWEQEDQS